MLKFLSKLLDFLFPPTKNELVIRDASLNTGFFYHPGHYRGIEYISHYSLPLIKAAITENKFHRDQKAAEILGSLLELWLVDQTYEILFIPIPLGKQRFRQRGYNQVYTILSQVKTNIKINTDVLTRIVETKPQSNLEKSDRQNNITKAFKCDSKKLYSLENVRIILLDDVTTTGATLLEARATLTPHLPSSVKLSCLAIAH